MVHNLWTIIQNFNDYTHKHLSGWSHLPGENDFNLMKKDSFVKERNEIPTFKPRSHFSRHSV